MVDEARRRCAAADGGALKICGLPPQLARIFRIAGVAARSISTPTKRPPSTAPGPSPPGPDRFRSRS